MVPADFVFTNMVILASLLVNNKEINGFSKTLFGLVFQVNLKYGEKEENVIK